ncbi:adenylate cyclase [Burkholderia ubonensis]|uniref:MoaF-related domain-containing protein n=1 Tax=Burkholderia ubonensis TaxID=101571 RepID=UPI0008FDFE8F|nr:adenylate cyclase [Burkholderia ubonensis]OJA24538.1 adenylate cyclase [Burkholderia ubonensis]OJB25253.1 adenylate cyclase [Burkholderia ubonensis]
MNASTQRPPFAGKTFEVRYDSLTAINAYADDGVHMRCEITEGDFTGAKGEVAYTWQYVAGEIYAISWQEADRATVVHIDDFAAGTSRSLFTASSLDFYRLEGSLRAA